MNTSIRNLGYSSSKTDINNNIKNKNKIFYNNINDYNTFDDNISYYISLILLIYFGSKIFYGIVDLTPRQPLDNEITNFITMIVLSQILFYLNNYYKRNIFSMNINNSIFYFGIFIGSIIPYYYHYNTDNNIYKKNTEHNSNGYMKLLYVISILFLFALNILNSFEIGNTNNYFIRIIAILIIIYGIFSLNKSSNINKVYKNKNIIDEDMSEMDKKQLIDETKKDEEYEKVGGSKIKFGLGLSAWLLSLLFPYSSQNLYINEFFKFISGILLSCFITDIALYGICYPIINDKNIKCNNTKDCKTKGIIISDSVSYNIRENITKIKYLGIITFIIILFIIIYLFMTKL